MIDQLNAEIAVAEAQARQKVYARHVGETFTTVDVTTCPHCGKLTNERRVTVVHREDGRGSYYLMVPTCCGANNGT